MKYRAYIEPRKIRSSVGSYLCHIFEDYEEAQNWIDEKHESITKDGEYEIIDFGIIQVEDEE